MKAPLKYHPDLRDCMLEDRLLPATVPSNLILGTIMLTTGGSFANIPLGVMVLTPGGYILQSALPGIAIPASFVMTGSAGISGMQPGNGTGNGGGAATIVVGSGGNAAGASIIPLVTRNTVVNDARNAAPLIGRLLRDRSDVLPPGQVYRVGVPTEVHGQRGGQDADEGPVEPLPIQLGSRLHRLASGASGYPVSSHADRAP